MAEFRPDEGFNRPPQLPYGGITPALIGPGQVDIRPVAGVPRPEHLEDDMPLGGPSGRSPDIAGTAGPDHIAQASAQQPGEQGEEGRGLEDMPTVPLERPVSPDADTVDLSPSHPGRHRTAAENGEREPAPEVREVAQEPPVADVHTEASEVNTPEEIVIVEPQTEKERIVTDHLEAGIELIKSGAFEQARRHFVTYIRHPDGSASGIEVGSGNTRTINSLQTEEELRVYTAHVARHSTAPGGGATLGGWRKTGTFSSNLDNDPNFDPTLVRLLNRETAVTAAEEWVHMRQHTRGEPVAGYAQLEVDAAAYLEARGVELSPDFITRYPERIDWYVNRHPERMQTVLDFCDRFVPAYAARLRRRAAEQREE